MRWTDDFTVVGVVDGQFSAVGCARFDLTPTRCKIGHGEEEICQFGRGELFQIHVAQRVGEHFFQGGVVVCHVEYVFGVWRRHREPRLSGQAGFRLGPWR